MTKPFVEDKENHVERVINDEDYKKRWFANLGKTIAVDFDGVLHPYSEGWIGFTPADEPPTPGAKEFLQELADRGYQIIIFSTRCAEENGMAGTKAWLTTWGLIEFITHITCKKPPAIAYIDDRAVTFRGNFQDLWPEIDTLASSRHDSHGNHKVEQP